MNVLSEYFGFPCRLCLQHSKKNTEKGYAVGFDQVVPNLVEMVAFQPQFAFSIAADALLESLVDAEQDTSYLTCARVGGGLIATGSVWSAPWASSFQDGKPGYSTFIPQVLETGWNQEDVMFGSTKHATTDAMIKNMQRLMRTRHGDQAFAEVYHSLQDHMHIKDLSFAVMVCGNPKGVATMLAIDASHLRNSNSLLVRISRSCWNLDVARHSWQRGFSLGIRK